MEMVIYANCSMVFYIKFIYQLDITNLNEY
jgi:hypothetical protein